jgi:NADH-quinone oxidoreductase subunit A
MSTDILHQYLPVVVFLAVAIGFGLLLLIVAKLLGPKRETAEKSIPYECGQDPASVPRSRFSVKFYRIAILFLIFDLEAAFFYPWAVLYRDLSCKGTMQHGVCHGSTTPYGFMVMIVFLTVLVLALMYVWRKKALEWD